MTMLTISCKRTEVCLIVSSVHMIFGLFLRGLGFRSISQLLLAASLTLQLRSLKEYLRNSECWQSKLQKLKSLIVGCFFHIKKTHRIHVWYIYYIHTFGWYVWQHFLVNMATFLGEYTMHWSGIVLSGPTFFYIIYLSISSDMLATCLGSLGSCICQTPHLAKPSWGEVQAFHVYK